MKEHGQLPQKLAFKSTVGGQIKNVHTKNDTTLVTFNVLYVGHAIGRSPQYLNDLTNVACEKYHPTNEERKGDVEEFQKP